MLKQALMVTAVIAAFGFTSAMADHGGKGKRFERMTEKLNLTQAQQDQIKSFHEVQKTKRQNIKNNVENQIKAVLNAEQAAKLRAKIDKRKARMEERKQRMEQGEGRKHRGHGHHGKRGGGKGGMKNVDRHLKRLTRFLNLDQAQQTAIRPVLENAKTQMEQLKTERDQYMQTILVGEQLTKFQEMKQKREARRQEMKQRHQEYMQNHQ